MLLLHAVIDAARHHGKVAAQVDRRAHSGNLGLTAGGAGPPAQGVCALGVALVLLVLQGAVAKAGWRPKGQAASAHGPMGSRPPHLSPSLSLRVGE